MDGFNKSDLSYTIYQANMTEEGTWTEGNHHNCDYLEQTQYYTEIMRHLKHLQHTNMKSLMGTTTRGEFSEERRKGKEKEMY